MTQIARAHVEKALEEACLDDDDDHDIRDTYQGRSMNGRSCFGVVLPGLRDVFTFLAALGAVMDREGADWFQVARAATTDNMGFETILYFPGVTLDDGDADA